MLYSYNVQSAKYIKIKSKCFIILNWYYHLLPSAGTRDAMIRLSRMTTFLHQIQEQTLPPCTTFPSYVTIYCDLPRASTHSTNK